MQLVARHTGEIAGEHLRRSSAIGTFACDIGGHTGPVTGNSQIGFEQIGLVVGYARLILDEVFQGVDRRLIVVIGLPLSKMAIDHCLQA